MMQIKILGMTRDIPPSPSVPDHQKWDFLDAEEAVQSFWDDHESSLFESPLFEIHRRFGCLAAEAGLAYSETKTSTNASAFALFLIPFGSSMFCGVCMLETRKEAARKRSKPPSHQPHWQGHTQVSGWGIQV